MKTLLSPDVSQVCKSRYTIIKSHVKSHVWYVKTNIISVFVFFCYEQQGDNKDFCADKYLQNCIPKICTLVKPSVLQITTLKQLPRSCFHVKTLVASKWKTRPHSKSYFSLKENPRSPFEAILGLNFKLVMIPLCLPWDFTKPLFETPFIPLVPSLHWTKPGKTDHLHGASVAGAGWSRVKSFHATIIGWG